MPRDLCYCLPNTLKKHKDAKLSAYQAFLDGMTGALVSSRHFIGVEIDICDLIVDAQSGHLSQVH